MERKRKRGQVMTPEEKKQQLEAQIAKMKAQIDAINEKKYKGFIKLCEKFKLNNWNDAALQNAFKFISEMGQEEYLKNTTDAIE